MFKSIALASCLFASSALAALPGVVLDTTVRFEFTNCASAGSAAQTVTAHNYLLRVTDDAVFVCFAGTCASGGEKFPNGTLMLLTVPASTSVSCNSASSSGDLILTKAD